MNHEEDLLIGDEISPDPTTGELAPVGEGADVNRYFRTLRRAKRERAEILGTFDAEIERLKKIRDDRVAAPNRLIEMVEGALASYHRAKYEEAVAAGVPEKKRPISINLPSGKLTSRAGSKRTVPVDDESDEYGELFLFAIEHAPDAIVVVPPVETYSKLDYGKLKAAADEISEPDENGLARLLFTKVDPETGEVEKLEAPGVRIEVGDRTYSPLADGE